MSKAQRKRNRKIRNLSMNWGRIAREYGIASEVTKRSNRNG